MMNTHRRKRILMPRIIVAFLSISVTAAAVGDEPAKPRERPSGKQSGDEGKKSAKKPRTPRKDAAASRTPQKQTSGRFKADMSPVPPDKKAERKDLAALGDTFKLHRTAHYSVIYDTSEADLKLFEAAIEKTYRSCMNYTQRLGFEAHLPRRKLIIYFFEHHPDYSAYSVKLGVGPQDQSTPGIFIPDLNRSMFYNFRNQDSFRQAREQAEQKIVELREQLRQPGADRRKIAQEIAAARRVANFGNTLGGDINEEIVQHEVAHQVLWNIGFHNPDNFLANPRWLAEGTAMLFEPISTGSSANFGALNKGRLREYQMLVDTNRLIPLRDFISTHAYFGPSTIDIAYPQSWALVHYLNRTRRPQMKEYVEMINRRPKDYETTPEQEIADFEKVFGKIDERWINRWQTWMSKVR